MTQYEADLRYWVQERNSATGFTLWRIAQAQIDSIFVAMGYKRAPLAAIVDEEFVFPQIQAGFEVARGGRD